MLIATAVWTCLYSPSRWCSISTIHPALSRLIPTVGFVLKRLAGILNFVTDIRLEINGYTDNVGTGSANQALSEKRARRVRDFLVANGVDTERITVFGRGETNFVASNQTAEGRAKNRRIEIVFHK